MPFHFGSAIQGSPTGAAGAVTLLAARDPAKRECVRREIRAAAGHDAVHVAADVRRAARPAPGP